MMRHGPFRGPATGAPPPEHMEKKIMAQVVEIERLRMDNQRLAATHVALRHDVAATQHEIQRLQSHIGSIQTESDIQIRMLLEKIKKMEVDILASESLRRDLQQAHKEAQSLVAMRQELTTEIQQSTQELQKAHVEVAELPDLHSEVKILRQEHQRLRAEFEYEKRMNMELVEKLQAREKNLISMAKEIEKLRVEVQSAEKRVYAPYSYGPGYSNPESSYPPAVQDGGLYMAGYARP